MKIRKIYASVICGILIFTIKGDDSERLQGATSFAHWSICSQPYCKKAKLTVALAEAIQHRFKTTITKKKHVSLNRREIWKWAKDIIEMSDSTDPAYIAFFPKIIEDESAFRDDYIDFIRLAHIPKVGKFFSTIGIGWIPLPYFDSWVPASRDPTLGCMQVRLSKAIELAEKDMKKYTPSEMKAILLTRQGALSYGKKLLDDIVSFYATDENGTIRITDANRRQIKFDYSAGKGTCRDAAVQYALWKLGYKVNIDGELGNETEHALIQFVQDYKLDITAQELREFLKLKKQKEIETTQIYTALKEIYQQKVGQNPPYAILPTGQRYVILFNKAFKKSYKPLDEVDAYQFYHEMLKRAKEPV